MNDGPPTATGERTVLAWQRTAFSLLAGAAVLSRLTADSLGAATSLAGLAVTASMVLWVLVVAGRRTLGHPRDGRPAAALTAGIVVVGLTELAAVLLGAIGR